MIAVTEIAQQKLSNYLRENNISSPLRIALMQGGCSGAALGLAIDETKEDDFIQSFEEVTFLMKQELLEQCGSISVDFIESGSKSGFSIQSANPLPGAGTGCMSGSCNSGGCGC
jgi:iron-sulfur cluster assembly accessory protein